MTEPRGSSEPDDLAAYSAEQEQVRAWLADLGPGGTAPQVSMPVGVADRLARTLADESARREMAPHGVPAGSRPGHPSDEPARRRSARWGPRLLGAAAAVAVVGGGGYLVVGGGGGGSGSGSAASSALSPAAPGLEQAPAGSAPALPGPPAKGTDPRGDSGAGEQLTASSVSAVRAAAQALLDAGGGRQGVSANCGSEAADGAEVLAAAPYTGSGPPGVLVVVARQNTTTAYLLPLCTAAASQAYVTAPLPGMPNP